MNNQFYKNCIVPQCQSTSIETPNKLFIYVPHDEQTRRSWLRLAGRDTESLSMISRMYFCEDHFDLPNDMENYNREYYLRGFVSQVQLKPGRAPSKFECMQGLYRTPLKQHLPTFSTTAIEARGKPNILKKVKDLKPDIRTEKCMQATTHKLRGKPIEVSVKSYSVLPSTSLPELAAATDNVPTVSEYSRTRRKKRPPISKRVIMDDSSSSSENFESSSDILSHSVLPLILSVHSNNYNELYENTESTFNMKSSDEIVKNTFEKIMNEPNFYIAVPKECFHIIDIIVNIINVPKYHLLLCLKKIRLDSKFQELADDFVIAPSKARTIFFKTTPMIADVLRPFIVKLEGQLTKKSLPMPMYYHNVSCFIYCLEIEVKKPSYDYQTMMWSDSKKMYTIKYLISFTLNGLVNYISPGYGGRISNTSLVKSCGFEHFLEQSMTVMADYGFNNLEQYLLKYGVQLIKPPHICAGTESTSSDMRQIKQFERLKIYLETVKQCLSEFQILKQPECVNVNLFDDIVTIACALFNIQDSITK